ncbi:SIR2 family protein [Candidatus Margulisiibacteriota bacterium]
MKTVLVLGSGATVGANFKKNETKVSTDREFFKNKKISDFKSTYPALAKIMELFSTNESNLGLEETWTHIDNLARYYLDVESKNQVNKLFNEVREKLDQYISLCKYIKKLEKSRKKDYIMRNKDYKNEKHKFWLIMAGMDIRQLVLDTYSGIESKDNPLEKLIKKLDSENLSCITYNYDLGFEKSCGKKGYYYPIENLRKKLNDDEFFPFKNFDEQEINGIPIIKLHGSLNWEHKLDGFIYLTDNQLETKRNGYDEENKYCNECKQSYPDFFIQPAIVPPTLHKDEFYKPENHNKIFRAYHLLYCKAVEVLQKAEHIIFIGYSFPPTDPHAALMFRLIDNSPEKISIIDPNCCELIERFSNILKINENQIMTYGSIPSFINSYRPSHF